MCRATPQSWPIRPLKMMQRKTDMAFAISAFFPLGFYQGSDSGGRPESYPSPSRLYSALVSAAYLTLADLQQGHSDLNIWLRDDLRSEDREISVAVRHLPWDDALAIKLLEVTQPENDELFPIRKWYGLTKFFEELTNKSAKAEVVFEEETDSDKKIASFRKRVNRLLC